MKHSLERDLYQSKYILDKAAGNDTYCQILYAALCNNNFQKLEVEPILTNDLWYCSWRYAGGVASKLFNSMGSDDYMQYYCAGMGCDVLGGYVSEGSVTQEIRNDLKHIGWLVLIDKCIDE